MKKNIAVIGSGVSGLVSAYLLSEQHNVTVFEANDYIGGHTHTVNVNHAGEDYAIDTGFIVYNEKTYPNFCKLIKRLNIETQKSEMSFSYSSDSLNLEYNGHSLNSLFSDRRNVFSPRFYKMLSDIVRFNKQAKDYIQNRSSEDLTIAAFLKQGNYNDLFLEAYFIPMACAIWSATPTKIYESSANFILYFFENHGLLNVKDRPDWFVLKGGSSSYIPSLTLPFKDNIQLNTPVIAIEKQPNGVMIKTKNSEQLFDAAILAVHSDQALTLRANPSQAEIEILSAIQYQMNEVVLHYDRALLPKNPRAWASWNYKQQANETLASVTYYMNRLQGIKAPVEFCVSLNQTATIDKSKIIDTFHYAHPVFDEPAIAAQKRLSEISGDTLYYCGAYWGFGFHEDGVKSALSVCESFGIKL